MTDKPVVVELQPPSSEDLIDALLKLVKEKSAGNGLRAIAVMMFHQDTTAEIDWAGDCSQLEIVGALETVKALVIESNRADYDDG